VVNCGILKLRRKPLDANKLPVQPHDVCTTPIIIIIVYYAKWQHRKNTIIYTKYKNTFTKQNIKTDYKLKLQFILY